MTQGKLETGKYSDGFAVNLMSLFIFFLVAMICEMIVSKKDGILAYIMNKHYLSLIEAQSDCEKAWSLQIFCQSIFKKRQKICE